MAPYSMDLRTRVLRDWDAGLKAEAIAEKYAGSRAWVHRLQQRRRETGSMASRRQTRWRTPILAAQADRLEALIREQPDRTLAELQAALRTPAALSTIWRMIKQLGFTVKEKRYARPNRTAPTSARRGRRGGRPPRRWIPGGWCFWMKAGSGPICCAGTAGAAAASGSPITPRRRTGRPAPSWRPSASTG